MIELDNAYRRSTLNASQPKIAWNFWPLAALLLNALLWAGICWTIAPLL
ncbi:MULTISPECIES: hypothetical protein [unclassified Bradyrhizobium]|nr:MULTISPECIES: hypothetical protein [unclassified Bradyrhizobium]